jgi:hypothetical protein
VKFFLLVVLLTLGANVGDQGEAVTLHVKEVRRSKEATEYGFMTHIAAIVESKTIIYSIQCDETYNKAAGGFTTRCLNISAGKDYPAHKFMDAISFWPTDETRQGTLLVMYDIIEEKEK